jgi:hypothetical protein
MINSMQAYQLSAALAPSFLANVPAGKEANALTMQYGGAQQGVSAEAYKKALKDAEPSDFEKVLGHVEKGAGLVATGMGIASGMPSFGSGGGGGMDAYQTAPVGAPATTAPAMDMWGGGVEDPFNVYSNAQPAGGAPQAAPAASMAEGAPSAAPVVDATQAAKSSGSGSGVDMAAVAGLAGGAALMKGALDRGEANMAQEAAINTALKDVADPRLRHRIMNSAQMTPAQFKEMNPIQRALLVSNLLSAGIPLTKQQARALPAEERRSFQKQYGPDLVPMTGLDKFNSFLEAYEQQTGPGRIVRPNSGLEMYLP